MLSAVTSTLVVMRSTIERVGGTNAGIHTFDETRIVMNSLVGQRLWKWKLVAGLLTIVMGAIVLAWPGPTILVASTLFGVYLLLSGMAELFWAFTLPRIGGHPGDAVHQRRTVIGSGHHVVPSLRRRLRGAAAVAVDRNRLHLPRRTAVAVGIGESDLPGRGWYIAAGIISVIAGLVVLVWPFDSIAVLTLAAGIWLVIIGITQIIQAIQTRKAAKTARHAIDDVSDRLTTALSD